MTQTPATTGPHSTSDAAYHRVDRCRICGNPRLELILDLGQQCLTGVFPGSVDRRVTRGPIQLYKCHGAGGCGLVQLRHSYMPQEMYGENYGYRSGLNASMVAHLREVAGYVSSVAPPAADDVILDIGSNDGTTLSFYPRGGATLVGIDPTAAKFRRHYRPDIKVVEDFFSAAAFRKAVGDRKARIVTSIAMFYDMEQPRDFVNEVAAVLADEGVWHFEQSHLLAMIRANAYDTICHEHLEYYGLHQIQWMMERAGLKVIDVQLNDINGGSFAVTVAKQPSRHKPNRAAIDALLAEEKNAGLDDLPIYENFRRAVEHHRVKLLETLADLRKQKKLVLGYGASTKGNVILQYCGLTPAEIPAIADVNPDKWGCVTPGTGIPIISEADAHAKKPDVFLVLPWHFRDNLLKREAAFLQRGGAMLFPLPKIELVRQ